MNAKQAASQGWNDAIEGRNNWGRVLVAHGTEAGGAYRAAWLKAQQVI